MTKDTKIRTILGEDGSIYVVDPKEKRLVRAGKWDSDRVILVDFSSEAKEARRERGALSDQKKDATPDTPIPLRDRPVPQAKNRARRRKKSDRTFPTTDQLS